MQPALRVNIVSIMSALWVSSGPIEVMPDMCSSPASLCLNRGLEAYGLSWVRLCTFTEQASASMPIGAGAYLAPSIVGWRFSDNARPQQKHQQSLHGLRALLRHC